MKKLLIALLCFNEEAIIKQVYDKLQASTKSFADVIVINDGSSDNSLAILQTNKIPHLSATINSGINCAMHIAFKYAYENNYQYIIQFDGDGQHSPADVKKMYEMICQGKVNIVIGSRYFPGRKKYKNSNGKLRALGNSLLKFSIVLISGKKITDPTSGLRMFDDKIIKLFAKNTNLTVEPDTLCFLLRNKLKIGEISAKPLPRLTGESYLNFINSLFYMTEQLISILFFQIFRKL